MKRNRPSGVAAPRVGAGWGRHACVSVGPHPVMSPALAHAPLCAPRPGAHSRVWGTGCRLQRKCLRAQATEAGDLRGNPPTEMGGEWTEDR